MPEPAGVAEALVLGGGGLGGIAWITGVLAGLADEGQDVTATADLIVGTSAGSTVGAQLGSGLGIEELYARQTEPALQSAEIMAEIDFEGFGARLAAVLQTAPDVEELRRAVGVIARDAETVPEATRREVIASRLPSHEWPERALKFVAVDAETGQPRLFDRESGVPLVDAVAASCAVPGVWPTTTIDGRRYYDGGVPSCENVEYAAGADRVLVIAPLGGTQLFPGQRELADAIAELRDGGARVALVVPDEASLAAIGPNALDPGTRAPAAAAGREQGRSLKLDWR